MKCTNCGTQFDEGIFCPECGTKCVMEESVETAAVMETKIEEGKKEKVEVEKKDAANTGKNKKKDKIPWYLSIPFILVVYMFTFWLLGIPGIILAIIRLIKCKKKVGTVFFIFLMLSPYILVVWLIVDNIKFENEIDSLISTGQYSQARTILDEKIEYGSQYMYFRLYCESYEVEGNYDEAAKMIIEYCNREETPLDITSGACDKLQELKEKVSPDIYDQIIQIEESIVQAEKKAEEEKKVEAEKVEETKQTDIESDSLDTESSEELAEEAEYEEPEYEEAEYEESEYEEPEYEEESDDYNNVLFCETKIKIVYEKTSFSYNDDVILCVDGEEVGEMKAGEEESFIVILEPGKHKIQAKSDTIIRNNNSNVCKFETEFSFEEVVFYLKDGSWGGLKLKMQD